MDAAEQDFTEYVAARQGALLRTAYLLTGHAQDAEDLVQAVLIKAVPHWPRITGNPEPYLKKALARENISRWRRRRWREVLGPPGQEPSQAPDGTDDRIDLAAALGALSPRQRAIVVLRHYEDLTERATAEALGISIGTVKSHHRDAMAKLRRLIGKPVDVDRPPLVH
ncbi:SigE family RNA polymerase sigma factor [Nocardioides limicola]|uniref:SigE family RNA polymerase sigma factor n=1 Tax=Nocardioides limicola TaxID=2803368 RepID=UPI00193B9C73|nr:SigE family RNA polymerase sigma factor [Nocardioides sp. DJM-14]